MFAILPILEPIGADDLDGASGGRRSVSITAPLGLGKYQSTQNDYSECITAAKKGGWSPKEVRSTCGLPNGSTDASGKKKTKGTK